MSRDISGARPLEANVVGDNVRDGFGFDLNRSPVEIKPARPPLIPICAEVTEKNMSQFMAEHAEPAWIIQPVVDRDAHFPLARAAIQRSEAAAGTGERLE